MSVDALDYRKLQYGVGSSEQNERYYHLTTKQKDLNGLAEVTKNNFFNSEASQKDHAREDL